MPDHPICDVGPCQAPAAWWVTHPTGGRYAHCHDHIHRWTKIEGRWTRVQVWPKAILTRIEEEL